MQTSSPLGYDIIKLWLTKSDRIKKEYKDAEAINFDGVELHFGSELTNLGRVDGGDRSASFELSVYYWRQEWRKLRIFE